MKNLTTTTAILVLFGAFLASVTAAPQYTGAKTPAVAARDKQKKTERDGTDNRLSPREKQDSIWDCVLDMGPQGVPMCERGLEAGGPED